MKLHYRNLGGGQPLIILHGLFGSSDNWQTLGKKIAEDYDVYLVDQRNHGRSPHSDDFSYDLMAADLLELIEDHYMRNVILVGHSMGGKTAIRFAQEHPEYIDKLVIVDIGTKQYPMHHDVILDALNSANLEKLGSRKAVEEHLSNYIDDFGVKQFLLKNLYWNDDKVLDWRINIPVLSKEMPEIIGGLPEDEVDLPTLFIRGAKSNYILEDDFEALHDQFSGASIKTLNTGHWVHAEAPQLFYEALMKFVED